MWSKKRIVWFVLMITTMALIFFFSNQNGEKSNAVGNTVAQTMNIHPENEWVNESHTELLFGLNLRKWAHVGLFGTLGITVFMWIRSLPKALIICLAYAILDELHQLCVIGREARCSDVCIDAIGFVLTIISLETYMRLNEKKRK